MYDIIIIGAGPGGYVAAERAGKLGKSVLIVEKDHLGGVCLNKGCIPTKTLLNSTKLYKQAKSSAPYGVHTEGVSFNWKEAMAWKNEVVESQRNGVSFLMKENNVEVLKGYAELLEEKRVSVNGKIYEGENIIISTGSSNFIPPVPGSDGVNVVTSDEILDLEKLPETIAVIGGGVIGIEFGSLFSNPGIKVDVIEMPDEIIPMMDKDHTRIMRREMKGINFHLSSQLLKIEGSKLTYLSNGEEETLEAELVLMAVGRRPNTSGLEKTGLDINNRKVVVNDKMETNLPGIYAVGDVTGLSMLVAGAAAMIESELRVKEIKEIIFSHPSLSEVIREAVWVIEKE